MGALLIAKALLLFYLPGALVFRLPMGERQRRSMLPAEERAFWAVVLSVACSLSLGFALAALEMYRFERLLLLTGIVIAVLLLAARKRLLYSTTVPRVALGATLPVVLVLIGLWRFYPASEYIIGGRDPGTYVNDGIQIAQRGTLTIHDPVIASVPNFARDLFFPSYNTPEYYSIRFMGFFLRNPTTGDVTAQFPQLFPLSIAYGYGLNGLTGARAATGVWAILGLVSVYFLGARLIGRPAAFAAAGLLGLNVAEVWFARYPNSELVEQALLFAAMLAFTRSHQGGDRFFGPVAAVLLGLSLFARIDAVPPIVAIVAAGLMCWLARLHGFRPAFVFCLVAALVLAWVYYTGPLLPYTQRAIYLVRALAATRLPFALAAIAACLLVLAVIRNSIAGWIRRGLPFVVIGVVSVAALYAAFLRAPGGRLTEFDAHALRTFNSVYLLWPGFAAALIGFVLVVRRNFWRDPAFVLVFSAVALYFFYKLQIPPGEFWAGRRYLAVILPGSLLFAAAAALGITHEGWSPLRIVRVCIGGGFLVMLGCEYAVNAAPVMPHVEYAGMIPYVERLAGRFGDRDLAIVEARNAGSDTHVLAVPLAYIYARNVLVLNSARPDKLQLRAFLEQAVGKYDRVLFVGGGGTDLLSRRIGATAVADERVKVPEFETAYQALPRVARRKDFDYSIYRLTLNASNTGAFTLDVGYRDDLHVLRFNAKETSDGRTIRWTGPQSFIAVPGLTGAEREVTLVMHDGGRPRQAPAAHVDVFLNDVKLGGADVAAGFREYRFPVPADLAAKLGGQEEPAQLRLVSSVWIPQQYFGGSDDRALGVMLDRVEVR